jgi:hypothetical protein
MLAAMNGKKRAGTRESKNEEQIVRGRLPS